MTLTSRPSYWFNCGWWVQWVFFNVTMKIPGKWPPKKKIFCWNLNILDNLSIAWGLVSLCNSNSFYLSVSTYWYFVQCRALAWIFVVERERKKENSELTLCQCLLFHLMFNLVWLGCLLSGLNLRFRRTKHWAIEECHTHTHPAVTKPSYEWMIRELKDLEWVRIRPYNNMLGVQSCVLWSTSHGIYFPARNSVIYFCIPVQLWQLARQFVIKQSSAIRWSVLHRASSIPSSFSIRQR